LFRDRITHQNNVSSPLSSSQPPVNGAVVTDCARVVGNPEVIQFMIGADQYREVGKGLVIAQDPAAPGTLTGNALSVVIHLGSRFEEIAPGLLATRYTEW
jgi:hypothetical protein